MGPGLFGWIDGRSVSHDWTFGAPKSGAGGTEKEQMWLKAAQEF